MRCHCCDTILSPNEIKFEKDHKRYAPCISCIDASGVEPNETDQLDFISDWLSQLDKDDIKTDDEPEADQAR